MSDNQPNRLDQIEALVRETVQLIRSNAEAIAANSSAIAANRLANEVTKASVDGLVQTIAEFSARSEARLNRLDDVVADIRATNQRLEQILEHLTQN